MVQQPSATMTPQAAQTTDSADAQEARLRQQALTKIQAVETDVNRLQAEAANLLPRVQQHTARLAAATWLRQALFTAGTALTQKGVTAAGNRLAYDSGMVSENLFRQLLTLDGVGLGMGPEVRAVRKALVLRIKQLQAEFDALRKRVLALPTSYPRLAQLEQVLAERAALLASDIETEIDEATDISSTSTTAADCSDNDTTSEADSSEEDTDEAMDDEDPAVPNAAGAIKAPASASFAAQFPAHLRFKPKFEEHAVASGGRLLVAALLGVRQADCDVTLDQGQRTLTVRGIRRLHSSFGGFAGYRWFEEAFTIPAAFDLSRPLRSQFAGGQLQILLPRAPIAAPTARPAPRNRYQQPQSRGFSRHYSQPNLDLFSGYCTPQTSRSYRPRRSPFAHMGMGMGW